MIKRPETWDNYMTASARQIKTKVILQRDLEDDIEYRYDGNLISVDIDKTFPKGKMFGFIVSAKMVLIVRDIDTPENKLPQIGERLKVVYWTDDELHPLDLLQVYCVQDVKRDTVKKTMTITAFDMLSYGLREHTYEELDITYPSRPFQLLQKISELLGFGRPIFKLDPTIGNSILHNQFLADTPFNFSPSTQLYDVLEDVEEFLGAFAYVNERGSMCSAQISYGYYSDEWKYTIDTNQYFDLTTEKPITFTGVKICNSLGDNVLLGTDTGYCPTIMDNGLFVNQDKINLFSSSVLNRYISVLKNLTPYSLKWRGNPAITPMDLITIQQVDGTSIQSLYYGEHTTYNGGYSVKAGWTGEKASDIRTNPNITQVIKQTSAFVDKVNNKVNIIAAENKDQDKKLSELEITANSINSRVSETQTQIDETNEAVKELSNAVSQTITPHDLTVEVQKQIKEGVSEVNTTTGFKFNDEGLTVSKSGNDISTQITENGMTVSKNSNVLLTANNEGVDAKNLHATTYLIVGKNSRFEDMGSNQSACFWIGG